MDQPPSPTALPPLPNPLNSSSSSSSQKRKLPTPQDLVTHYETQGLSTNEASMKVIEDLQSVLVRVIGSGRGRKDKFMAESVRKLDTANTRLAILEMKVDSKPGYVETLGLGVAAGAVLKEVGNVFPHVLGAIGQMWNAVRGATKS
ncbi:hypothetical protein GIB67_043176 [Kingdonia uniflora]|uniref:Uncharacterized protein n=1 Tax=Kingdonia uniflora TaxID=39325 RepID=A0A7J7NJF1_9MAGN|nr:hypothetical protein GIB67_043176 [Kingdonia uniflora]